jgi:hypothetical protein
MGQMLELAMFLGLGVVAVWTHVRFPRLRPGSVVGAALHVAVSFLAFALLPNAFGALLPHVPTRAEASYVALALLIPILTYLLLSWVWLVSRILHDLGGTPRGGHPAHNA